ncbi:MAG: lysoplasmalogenase family protein [Planctomycetaceae bacterium]
MARLGPAARRFHAGRARPGWPWPRVSCRPGCGWEPTAAGHYCRASYGLFRQGSPTGPFARWILLGMSLGTVGDFFLAGLLKFVPIPDPLLAGMGAFALGHLAYITGCARRKRATLNNCRVIFIAIAAWQLIGIAAWYDGYQTSASAGVDGAPFIVHSWRNGRNHIGSGLAKSQFFRTRAGRRAVSCQ